MSKYKKGFTARTNKLREQAYFRMIQKMPLNVHFAPNQVWRGRYERYEFIDLERGPFRACPIYLMSYKWKRGQTGHPDDVKVRGRHARRLEYKPVPEPYRELVEFAKSVGLTIRQATYSQNKLFALSFKVDGDL